MRVNSKLWTYSTLLLGGLTLTLACGDSGAGQEMGDETTGPSTGIPTTGDGDGDNTTSSETDSDSQTGDGDGDSTTGDGDGEGDGDGDDTTTTGSGPKFDVFSGADSGGGDGCGNEVGDATLQGTVFAPNGTIPVSGALVYVTNIEPDGIPDGVYCEECVELGCEADVTTTDVEGYFSLGTFSGGGKYLVVQKGQFMRVTPINIDPGVTVLPDEEVELPGEWSPDDGLYIPRIAVADGSYDRIEDALGKFGLADTNIANFEERTIAGTESFDLWDNGYNPASDGFVSQGNMGQLVSSMDNLNQYHVIFVPCSSDTYSGSLNQQQIDNIRAWVEAGGRWYVADWSAEFMQDVFPEYQTFYGGGDPDLGSYDSLADVLDDGLLEWLEALPDPLKDINPLNDENHPTLFQLPQVMTVDNWSGIQYPLPEVLVDDGQGGEVDVGHKVWLEGPGDNFDINNQILPLTVTGQYGCGKIQFTSYHTAEFFDYVGAFAAGAGADLHDPRDRCVPGSPAAAGRLTG